MSNSSDNLSLAHTCWNCKYHVVFAPKYRRKEFYGLKRLGIGAILRKLCEWKGIAIHEAEVCPDHVHMLILVPGLLRGHGGQKREEDRGAHPKSAQGGPRGRPADDRLRGGSVYG